MPDAVGEGFCKDENAGKDIMSKVGLIAGGGELPLEFTRAAKRRGERVVVFALLGMASPKLEEEAYKVYWLNIGQYRKFAFLLLKERVRRLALIGKVDKNVIYKEGPYDKEYTDALRGIGNKKDYSILEEVTRRLKKIGVEVIGGMEYLSDLMPGKGVLSRAMPDERIEGDMVFGFDIAKKLAGMDIGQTVVIKDKAVVAAEAMEGTDAAIERAGRIAGRGCVMVKVSRPEQDMRWDVPTVGPDTVSRLRENGFSALAIESGKMFLVDQKRSLEIADAAGIVVKAL
ncbi:MAG: UDP-2,3-diacylglucosamine diphosphatase LpxI [Candidatus Omnitrophota bacterium]